MRLKVCLLLLCLSVVHTAFAADISTNKLLIRGVNKITGHVSTMTATINSPLHFGDLTITPERCLTKSQEETPENTAYLRVYENTKDNPKKPVFNGWMFSSNPALSAMEHPVYDIWVIKCLTQSGKEDVVLPEKVSREDDLNLVADDDNPALAED